MASNFTPTVSVLLPVHNAEPYIRQALDSVFAQTFTDFELLALDDGSTDRSLAILRECAARDARLRVISRENRGLVPTLNELVAAARGPYLARMDADDLCHPQRFERQIAFLKSHPEHVAVGCSVTIVDPEGMPLMNYKIELTHEEIDAAHISGETLSRICHPTVMMRREAVISVGQYRDDYPYVEDLDLFLRLAEKGGKLANLPDVLLQYRHHVTSICYSRAAEQRDFGLKAVKAARHRRGMNDAPKIPVTEAEPEIAEELHHRWAWWALSAGNINTARKHALKALAKNPLNIKNLLTMYCAIRGR